MVTDTTNDTDTLQTKESSREATWHLLSCNYTQMLNLIVEQDYDHDCSCHLQSFPPVQLSGGVV